MMRLVKLAMLGVLALVFTASAAAPPSLFALRAPDQLDYLFMASDRPLLIRLHLRVGEKPYTAAWESWMDALFAWFDKDNNGELSPTETARLISAQEVSNYQLGGFGGGGGGSAPFATLDKNKDGKVSKEEFRAYYRQNGINPLRFGVDSTQARSVKQVNDAIYRRLGCSPKGKLTKTDTAKLSVLMVRLDEDEDEMLTQTELNSEGDNGEGVYGGFVGRPGMMVSGKNDTGLVELLPNGTAATYSAQLMLHYDKNKDRKLTQEEIGLDKTVFKSLDRNNDGTLDAEELERFFKRKPDLVIRAKVGKLGSGLGGAIVRTGLFGKQNRVEVVNQKMLPAALAKDVRKIDSDNLQFVLGDARIKLNAVEGNMGGRLQGIKPFLLQQFDGIADKNGVIERNKENESNRFIMQLFNHADKNADGKLTRAEFSAWLDLMTQASDAYVTVQVNDAGRSLFEVMDGNGDTKLSIREVRDVWSRLAPLCKDGKGLSQTELPRTLQVTLAQGQNIQQPVFFFNQTPVQAQPKGKAGAPVWFTKMDRNNDGDLSPREWLGSEETFKEIDTNKDGLISVEEAIAFEKKKAKPNPSKK